MQRETDNNFEWTRQHVTEKACMEELVRLHRGEGPLYSKRGLERDFKPKQQGLRQCANCRHQTSTTVETLFANPVTLNKWFATIHQMINDKGHICALQLSKMVLVPWHTVYRILRWLLQAMDDRDKCYMLQNLVEMEFVLVGGCLLGRHRRQTESFVECRTTWRVRGLYDGSAISVNRFLLSGIFQPVCIAGFRGLNRCFSRVADCCTVLRASPLVYSATSEKVASIVKYGNQKLQAIYHNPVARSLI